MLLTRCALAVYAHVGSCIVPAKYVPRDVRIDRLVYVEPETGSLSVIDLHPGKTSHAEATKSPGRSSPIPIPRFVRREDDGT